MTLVGVPNWQGRVSPVFDVAERLLVVEFLDGCETSRRLEPLDQTRPQFRVERLAALGVDVLICGAISSPLQQLVIGRGIRVLSQICGDVEEVLVAFHDGTLGQRRYAMPGCCGRQSRQRRCNRRGGR